MGLGAMLAVPTALAMLLGWLDWHRDPAPGVPLRSISCPAEIAQLRAEVWQHEEPTALSILEREDATPTPYTEPPHSPFLLDLEILVCNALGFPVADYAPHIALPGGIAVAIGKVTDNEGRLRLQFRARRPRAELEVCDPRGHRHLVSLTHESVTAFALALDEVVVGVRSNRNSVALWHHHNQQVSDDCELVLGSRPLPFAQFLEQDLAMVADMSVETSYRSSVRVSCVCGIRSRLILGTVLDVGGQPVPDVPVHLIRERTTEILVTGADGSFCFESGPENSGYLRAGDSSRGFAQIPLPDYWAPPIIMRLQTASVLQGAVIDSTLQPVDAVVFWRATDGSCAARTGVAADGSFSFDCLPKVPGSVIALHTSHGGLPFASLANVLPGCGPIILKASREEGTNVTIQLASGFPEDCEFRLWIQQESSRTSLVKNASVSENLRSHSFSVPFGWHSFAVSVPGYGWFDLGRHWCSGGGTLDLGTLSPPLHAPGRVTMLLPSRDAASPPTMELVQHRSDFDVRVVPLPPPGTPFQLPHGSYSVITVSQREPDKVKTVSFRLEVGRELVVKILD